MFSLHLSFILNFIYNSGDRGSNQKLAKMDIPCFSLEGFNRIYDDCDDDGDDEEDEEEQE